MPIQPDDHFRHSARGNPDDTTFQEVLDFIAANLPTMLTAAITTLPTSDPAVAGKLWADSGTVKVSAGA